MRGLTIAAGAMLAFGAKKLLGYLRRKAGRRTQREALQTWEAEGGAVPVSRSRTAAQVPPSPDPDRAIGR